MSDTISSADLVDMISSRCREQNVKYMPIQLQIGYEVLDISRVFCDGEKILIYPLYQDDN